MDRLTKRYTYDGKNHVSVDSRGNGISCSNFCTGCGKADCEDIRKALFKLAEYEDLEEQGKLLKLPISPKTPIYSIEYCCGKNSNNKAGLCYKGRCEKCERKSYHILEATAESSFKIFEIGKSVFLTKSAAEAALKEMRE